VATAPPLAPLTKAGRVVGPSPRSALEPAFEPAAVFEKGTIFVALVARAHPGAVHSQAVGKMEGMKNHSDLGLSDFGF